MGEDEENLSFPKLSFPNGLNFKKQAGWTCLLAELHSESSDS